MSVMIFLFYFFFFRRTKYVSDNSDFTRRWKYARGRSNDPPSRPTSRNTGSIIKYTAFCTWNVYFTSWVLKIYSCACGISRTRRKPSIIFVTRIDGQRLLVTLGDYITNDWNAFIFPVFFSFFSWHWRVNQSKYHVFILIELCSRTAVDFTVSVLYRVNREFDYCNPTSVDNRHLNNNSFFFHVPHPIALRFIRDTSWCRVLSVGDHRRYTITRIRVYRFIIT